MPLIGALLASVFLVSGTSGRSGAEAPEAHFVVTNTVIAPDLAPFTATLAPYGNGVRLSAESGFEPIIFRTMFVATQDAPNRIVGSARDISGAGAWRNGAFDGAAVDILRIENGAFRLVRSARIADGGFHASGWLPVTGSRVVPASETKFNIEWLQSNRPDVPYYFTVRAIDRSGNVSPFGNVVTLSAPVNPGQTVPHPDNRTVHHKLSGRESLTLDAPLPLWVEHMKNGVSVLHWRSVANADGYVVYRSSEPPEQHEGFHIALDDTGPAIRKGDLVFLRAKFLRPDRERLLTNAAWTRRSAERSFRIPLLQTLPDDKHGGDWQLVPHGPDTIVESPGETHLRIHLPDDQPFFVGRYNHAGLAQDWYEVLDPDRTYRFEVWMRGHLPQPVSFEFTGFYSDLPATRFSLTSSWKKFSATFKVPKVHPGRQAGQMRLRLIGPGRVDIDNFRVFRDDTDYLGLLPEDAERLKRSGMGALRFIALTATGTRTYDLAQLTNPPGLSRARGGNTLPQLLNICDSVGADPWLKVEPHLSPDEWLGLAEYLAAPIASNRPGKTERPWATKRAEQGRTSPWSARFDRLYFEIGNETWNGIFRPWVFPTLRDAVTGVRYSPGSVFGMYQEYVLEILKDSPYWPALRDKLVPVIGGWANSPDFGLDAIAASPHSRVLTIGAYIGGWDEDEGASEPTTKGFSSIVTQPLQTHLPRARGLVRRVNSQHRKNRPPVEIGTYEAGPGYAITGLNRANVSSKAAFLQEQAMKSVAAGSATLDSFLAMASAGTTLQNFFAFDGGPRWASHARWNKGGQTYPAWELLSLFNREGLGVLLATQTIAVPTRNLSAARQRRAVAAAPMVAAYATRRNDRLTLVVTSRRVPNDLGKGGDGRTSVRVDLPITSAKRMTRYRLSGTYDAHNVLSQESTVQSDDIPVPATLPRLDIPDLPPATSFMFTFDGVE